MFAPDPCRRRRRQDPDSALFRDRMTAMTDKTADLAGPGVSTYDEAEKILPNDYEPLLTPMERMEALFDVSSP